MDGYLRPHILEIEERMQSRATSPKEMDRQPCQSNDLVIHQEQMQLEDASSSLKQFESDALKRRAEQSARIADLEGRLALFHARLAKESAERGRDHAATMDDCINGPLEGVMRRALGKVEDEFIRTFMDPARIDGQPQVTEDGKEEKKDSTDGNKIHNLVSLERQINLLEAQMNHYRHVTLFHSVKDNFDSIELQTRTVLEPAFTLESFKADRREGAVVRRFDNSAGEDSRMLAEMQASRASSLGIVQKEIDSWKGMDESRTEHFLNEIRKLKDMIRKESDERKKQDAILKTTTDEEFQKLKKEIFYCAY